jgi:hypothetical protein
MSSEELISSPDVSSDENVPQSNYGGDIEQEEDDQKSELQRIFQSLQKIKDLPEIATYKEIEDATKPFLEVAQYYSGKRRKCFINFGFKLLRCNNKRRAREFRNLLELKLFYYETNAY